MLATTWDEPWYHRGQIPVFAAETPQGVLGTSRATRGTTTAMQGRPPAPERALPSQMAHRQQERGAPGCADAAGVPGSASHPELLLSPAARGWAPHPSGAMSGADGDQGDPGEVPFSHTLQSKGQWRCGEGPRLCSPRAYWEHSLRKREPQLNRAGLPVRDV